MKPNNTIDAILEALASQKQQGETSLIATIEPGLIQDAISALRPYKKLFAPIIPGVTDTAPIYATYEQMRQDDGTKHTILLLVECQTLDEFRDAIGRMPLRKSSEWRSFSTAESASPC